MQEMWLFGQLNTLGESEVRQQTDDNAKVVGELLQKALELRQGGPRQETNGAMEVTVDEGITNRAS